MDWFEKLFELEVPDELTRGQLKYRCHAAHAAFSQMDSSEAKKFLSFCIVDNVDECLRRLGLTKSILLCSKPEGYVRVHNCKLTNEVVSALNAFAKTERLPTTFVNRWLCALTDIDISESQMRHLSGQILKKVSVLRKGKDRNLLNSFLKDAVQFIRKEQNKEAANPDVPSLQEMVMLYKSTEDYQQLADIFFDPKAEKYWAMAQQECSGLSQEADIYHRLDEVPDSLRTMMTPEQTLALFNAWCDEQNVNARALAWIIIACLQARIYKKIGVYLQGASNSGKTYWTSTLFHPLNKLVGKMTTGGRFCLQDCGKKRIIVGEEVGIAADNVDRLKELMSGEVTTFERKMKSPGTCKANLVLLNSNNLPFANVPGEKQALENRMFLFRNLKKSKILPTALKGMEATKPNPKFLRLVEPPTGQELQDLVAGIYPRTNKVVDNLGLVPVFSGDWESWSEELSQNRKVLVSDMQAPEFVIDSQSTLASVIPINQSEDLFTPPCPEELLNIRVEKEWPFESQPQQEEDLREELRYFFPTISSPEVIEPTPKNDGVQSDESRQIMEFVQEAYCAYEPEHIASQTEPFDQVQDENPWKKYDARWPGASEWAIANPALSAYHALQWTKSKGFYWEEVLTEMSKRNFDAVRFVMDRPRPTKRAKLICRKDGQWQWRCPSQDESFFKNPAPKNAPVKYLELRTGSFEENVHDEPINAWSTEDFYLDGAGYFIHKDCDKSNGMDIVYVMLKNGAWDIVTKTRVPAINREGNAVRKIVMDASQFLNFLPSDDVRDACTPKMMPVWLPRSFVNTNRHWTEDDMDTIADLFYLICGYTQPFKARILSVGAGPIHRWTDVSECYPDMVKELEEEAQCCVKKIIEGIEGQDMVDGEPDQPQKRSLKVMKFLSKFIETAAATVAMVVTIIKIWDEIF